MEVEAKHNGDEDALFVMCVMCFLTSLPRLPVSFGSRPTLLQVFNGQTAARAAEEYLLSVGYGASPLLRSRIEEDIELAFSQLALGMLFPEFGTSWVCFVSFETHGLSVWEVVFDDTQ